MNEAHAKAREIIEEHKDTHELIAEKLLEVETLDANEIKSLFETGEMPQDSDNAKAKYPSEKTDDSDEAEDGIGTSYEEIVSNQEKVEQKKNKSDRFTDNDSVEDLKHIDENDKSEDTDETDQSSEAKASGTDDKDDSNDDGVQNPLN